MKKQGILFDLDGTLWDSGQAVVDSWNEVLERLPDVDRHITVEDMHSYMGLPMDEIGRRCFAGQNLSEERIREIMHECEQYENEYILIHGGVLMPHLEEVLRELSKDYFLAVVSNCQIGYIEAFIEHHKLSQYFDDTENYGKTGLPKGDNIRLVCDRNQLEQALYVGDIQGDYDSACVAGIPFIHARYGFGTIDTEVPYIDSLTELRSVTEAIFQNRKK